MIEELRRGLSIVVPAYRSASILPLLVEELKPVLDGLGLDYELIIVNDCSPDDTGDVIDQLSDQHDWVRGVHLMTNYGQHNALLCGIRMARYDTTVTMDDDLQHPPSEIPRLLTALAPADVVYGSPEHDQHSMWRVAAGRLTRMLLQHAMGETASKVSAFRAFRTQLRDAFAHYQSNYVSIDALLTYGTRRFVSVSIRHQPRRAGVSNYTFTKLLGHAITMMTAFSTIPLRFASMVGLATTLLGVGLLIRTLLIWTTYGDVVPGWYSTAVMLCLFSGAQLVCIGIIGEYIGRVHFRLTDRPAYTVRRVTSTRVGVA
ncbi:MAG TPA: glycosyltransferase family 2 protein [Candidatus Xenobia bacterium]